MKIACRKTLTFALAAVYLAVACFGHLFHTHGFRSHCACRHHGHAHACDSHEHGAGSYSALLQWRSATSSSTSSNHECAACKFYSHHAIAVDDAEQAASNPATDNLAKPAGMIALVTPTGPQQPRAPPPSA